MYNMQLNTGYAGKPHVTAENCADLNRGIVGSDSYVLPVGAQFEVELVTNNLLKIKDGCGCMQGRQVSIAKGQTDEITIENGTQGEKRIDLVVIRYSKNADTGIETAIPFLVKGIPSKNNPVRPEHLEGDIRGGDLTADWPLYELYLDGISVTNVKPLFDVLMSVDSLNRNLSEGFSPLTSDSNGIYRHPSGLMLQWGIYPSAAMTKNDGVGGYLGKIKFKESFAGTPQCFTTCHYWGGNTQTGTQDISSASVTLYSKSAATDLGVRWLALGSWK